MSPHESTSSDQAGLPADLRERVLHAASRTPALDRGDVLRRRLTLLGLAAAVSIGVFLAWGGLRMTGRLPILVAATCSGAALVTTLVTALLFERRKSMLPLRAGMLLALVLVVPVVLFAWKYGVSLTVPGGTVAWPERPGFRCLRLSLLLGLAPLAAFLALRARTATRSPVLLGALLGMAAGSWSWTLVDLWCPVAYPLHLLLGHILPLVLLATAGALLGRWILPLNASASR